MKILNLVDLEKSDIKYKINKFPDGQQNVNILSFKYGETYIATQTQHYKNFEIKIVSRLNNWRDLELIVCSVATLKELSTQKIHLYVPYFLGARSDRKFEEGGNWYLKQVICPIINSLNFESVTVLDAHSNVLGNLLNNYKAIDNEHLVSHFAIIEIIKNMGLPTMAVDEYHVTPKGLHYDKRGFNNIVLVSPDAGASHKIEKLANAIGYTGDIITCTKERDTEGRLTKTVVPIRDGENDKNFIIIDDICDGGRTFINIAQKIREYYNHEDFDGYQPKIYLIVTHGIFSAGFTELNKYFDGIYCTNSYKNIGDYVGNDMEKTFVTQLNVF